MNVPAAMQELLEARAASVLCARPPVLASFDSDFAKRRAAFAEFARANPGTAVVLQLGWECETPEAVARLSGAVEAYRAEAPGSRVAVLANAGAEVAALERAGIETHWVQHNAFLDERRYRPLGGAERPFDAAYIARLTPFKRHGLLPVELAPRLLFLGASVRPAERDFAAGVREKYAAARWVPSFSGAKVSCWLALAKCGLALSATEGACFASAEYPLCGLPVVDTPALGGRAALYPEEFVRSVGAAPEAIAEGIAHWAAHRPDPRKVRAAWLAKAAPHRDRFRRLLRELAGRDLGRPQHKLGLRTPHPGLAFTLAIQAWLWTKGRP